MLLLLSQTTAKKKKKNGAMGLPDGTFKVLSAVMALAMRSSGDTVEGVLLRQHEKTRRRGGNDTVSSTALGLHDRHVRCKWSRADLPKALP